MSAVGEHARIIRVRGNPLTAPPVRCFSLAICCLAVCWGCELIVWSEDWDVLMGWIYAEGWTTLAIFYVVDIAVDCLSLVNVWSLRSWGGGVYVWNSNNNQVPNYFYFYFFPSWSIYLSLNAKQPSEENPKFRSLRISTRNNRRGPNLYSHKEHASSSPSCGEKADDRSEVQKGGVGGGHSDLQVGVASNVRSCVLKRCVCVCVRVERCEGR